MFEENNSNLSSADYGTDKLRVAESATEWMPKYLDVIAVAFVTTLLTSKMKILTSGKLLWARTNKKDNYNPFKF